MKKKGDKFVKNNGTLLAVKFKDRKVFQMLLSVHSIADVEVGQNHPGTGRPITKPGLYMTTTSSWGQLTGVIRWWPIPASGDAP